MRGRKEGQRAGRGCQGPSEVQDGAALSCRLAGSPGVQRACTCPGWGDEINPVFVALMQPLRFSWAHCGQAERQKGGFVSPRRALSPLNKNCIFSHPPACPCSRSPVGDTVKFRVTLRR